MATKPVEEVIEVEEKVVLVTPGSSTISPEMQQVLAAMQQNLLAAVAEMKKPSAEDQEKLDAEKARRLNNAKQSAEAVRRGEEEKARLQQTCSHSLPNGKTAFRAQINSDKCYRPFCPMCGYISKPIRGDQFVLNNQPIDLYKMDAERLTIPKLEEMAKASLAPEPRHPLPVGATADFAAV